MPIDREQAEVYEILGHLGCRLGSAIVFLIAFCVVLGFTLWKPSMYLVAVDVVLGPTTFLMAKFLFPTQRGSLSQPATPKQADTSTPTKQIES